YLLDGSRDIKLRSKIESMAAFAYGVSSASWRLPFIGGDDGGRLFHPYGDRSTFVRASVATCGALLGRHEWIRSPEDLLEIAAWWLPEPIVEQAVTSAVTPTSTSQNFPHTGLAVLTHGDVSVVLKHGGFGEGGGGHSHADTLS